MAGNPENVVVPRRAVVADVLAIVAREYELDAVDILGRGRCRGVAEARLMVYALLRDVTGMSYPEIAKALNRDHTSVMHGVKKTAALVSRDPYTAQAFWRMRREVKDAREARRVA